MLSILAGGTLISSDRRFVSLDHDRTRRCDVPLPCFISKSFIRKCFINNKWRLVKAQVSSLFENPFHRFALLTMVDL